MSSSSESQPSIRLTVKRLGHVPSFKNQKSIMKAGDGRRFIGTKPERKEWMEQTIQSFMSQLRSLYQTTTAGMETVPNLRSWIASCMPSDDSRQWIVKGVWEWQEVPPGEEGAIITITKIDK